MRKLWAFVFDLNNIDPSSSVTVFEAKKLKHVFRCKLKGYGLFLLAAPNIRASIRRPLPFVSQATLYSGLKVKVAFQKPL